VLEVPALEVAALLASPLIKALPPWVVGHRPSHAPFFKVTRLEFPG
jgi:hypothetical protein